MLLRLPAKYINLEVNGIEPPPKKKNSNFHTTNVLYYAQPTLQ